MQNPITLRSGVSKRVFVRIQYTCTTIIFYWIKKKSRLDNNSSQDLPGFHQFKIVVLVSSLPASGQTIGSYKKWRFHGFQCFSKSWRTPDFFTSLDLNDASCPMDGGDHICIRDPVDPSIFQIRPFEDIALLPWRSLSNSLVVISDCVAFFSLYYCFFLRWHFCI